MTKHTYVKLLVKTSKMTIEGGSFISKCGGGLIVTTNTYLMFGLMNNIEIGICEGLKETLLLT